ncbi:hypothetical protein Tco_0320795 [Tanacetum coccineum]
MPTEMELTLEQTQHGVSYEVLNIRVTLFTVKMEILLEPTSNKLMVERFNTTAGNPVKKILLKLNLSDHRSILMDLKMEVKVKFHAFENVHRMDSRSTGCGVRQFKTYMLHRLEKARMHEDVEAKHRLAKSDPRKIQKYYSNFYEKIIKEEMAKYYQIETVLYEVLKTVVPPSKVEAENEEDVSGSDSDSAGDDDGDGDNEIGSFNDDGVDTKIEDTNYADMEELEKKYNDLCH